MAKAYNHYCELYGTWVLYDEHCKDIAAKDSEIAALRAELSANDAEIEEIDTAWKDEIAAMQEQIDTLEYGNENLRREKDELMQSFLAISDELSTIRQLAREALVFDYEVPLGHREVMKAFDTLRQIAQEVEK